jgi:glyoxylase-like metal-dependent hydrolase (beta-lactamase superfamily II)
MRRAGSLIALGISLVASTALAQRSIDSIAIKTNKITENVYMLEGAGGNIGVSVGEDGVVLVDDQFAPLSPKIQAAIAAITPKPIRFVINTHWHGDHTGGNEPLALTGTVVVAHENVRKRMSVGQFMELINGDVPPAAPKALPIVTFTSDITLHLNGEEIRVIHPSPAHTDGDSVVLFTKAKVVHMGDCFMTISFPYVDYGSGGNYDGYIALADKVLGMADASLKIIPGHGVISTKTELKSWRDMLSTIRARVKKQIDAGKSLDAIKKLKLTAEWDENWGKVFVQPDQIVEFAYKAIKGLH